MIIYRGAVIKALATSYALLPMIETIAPSSRDRQVEETPIGSHTPEPTSESQRRDPRDSLFVLGKLRPEGEAGESETVRVRNVSSGGLMADASDHYRPGARVEVELEGIGTMSGSVAWSEAGRIGIAFDHPIDKSRARKTKVKSEGDEQIFRPLIATERRPGLKPR